MLQKKIKNNFLELINQIIFILFLFFISSSHLFSSSLFPQVKSNALWIKSSSILDTTSIDSLVNFSVENKINNSTL